jgi:hypothetical protein
VEYGRRKWEHGGCGNRLELHAAAASGADVVVLAQDGYEWELRDVVGGIGANAGCFTIVAVYDALATLSSSSVGPHPTLRQLRLIPLSSLPAVSPLCRQHSHIALGLLVHPPVRLCPRLFGIGILPSYWNSTRLGCIGEVAGIAVFGRTSCEKVESGDELRYGSSLLVRLCVRYSRILYACDTHRAVLAIIHPTLTTRSATGRGRVDVAS